MERELYSEHVDADLIRLETLTVSNKRIKSVAYGCVFEVLKQNKITPEIEPPFISGGNFRRRRYCQPS
jgi:hypothetical protein